MMKARDRQKNVEKPKKRKPLPGGAQARSTRLPGTRGALIRLARGAGFGPAWITRTIEQSEDDSPRLVTVVLTRALRDGKLLPCVALVDRTCLGIKNAFIMEPTSESALEGQLEHISDAANPLQPCAPRVAQSVVFHALDYARSLGFEPHASLEPALFGPRPSALLSTPLSTPDRPYYIQGPDDDAAFVVGRLLGAVGPGNFVAVLGSASERSGQPGTSSDRFAADVAESNRTSTQPC